MTLAQILQTLESVDSPTIMTLSPGPARLRVSRHDAMAAKLLQWLFDELGDDGKLPEAMLVIHNAAFWLTFFASSAYTDD